MSEFQAENEDMKVIKAPSIIVLGEQISKEAFESKWNELLLKNSVLNNEIGSSGQIKGKWICVLKINNVEQAKAAFCDDK